MTCNRITSYNVCYTKLLRWFFRIDLTTEKRYSLSAVSKEMLSKLDAPIKVDLYLDGDLPPGFRQLQQAVEEKVQDMDAWAAQRVQSERRDPYDIANNDERNNFV